MKRALTAALAVVAAATASAQVLTEFPRASNGRPDLSGVWQTLNTAHWNVEPHVADYPVLLELGAQFAVPPGPGVVVGGEIPYLPEARAERDRRFENRLSDDPEGKCYLGGVPRSTYMPYPFQILQSERDVVIYYQFATAFRRIFVDGKEEAPLDSWMGWSNGRWDGDTFVVLRERQREDHRALQAARPESPAVRSDDRRRDRVLASLDDSHAALSNSRRRLPRARVQVRALRGREVYGHLHKPGTEPPAGASSR
jgi:hypothetical protein